ncbi:bifunctional DNA primase/polymerase [Glutamicibacter arilaitensis]|uniref:bifunctional DNA primase/polymerase n=1 Tax=Glutamicibacter arilaitensis TaxID=256701 RepID=UPI003FD01A06
MRSQAAAHDERIGIVVMMPDRGAVSSVLLHVDPSWSLSAAAREFARSGVPVFPCAPNGKRPITAQGFHDATTDLRQIEAWWDQIPNANIGLPTGAASGAVVVDVDVHGPVNGYEALERSRRAGVLGAWELTTRSPSGGTHLFYPATPGTEQRSWQAARAGIDFRGDGGYIVVPPSRRVIDGQQRRYGLDQVNTGPATGLDARRLRDFLDPRPVIPPPESRGVGRSPDVSELAARVASLREGERNLGLFKAACRLAENGTPPADALAELGAAAGQAGLGQREITRTVRSAYDNVGRFGPRYRASMSPQQSTDAAEHRPSHPPVYRGM